VARSPDRGDRGGVDLHGAALRIAGAVVTRIAILALRGVALVGALAFTYALEMACALGYEERRR
jgi:hypothetical protein